jgi:hypothetical protein
VRDVTAATSSKDRSSKDSYAEETPGSRTRSQGCFTSPVQANTRSLKTQGKQLIAAETTASATRRSPTRSVKAILKIWKSLLAPASSASIDLEGARADVVRKALKTFVKGTLTERRRMCMDAVRGLRCARTAGPRGSDYPGLTVACGHEIKYALDG